MTLIKKLINVFKAHIDNDPNVSDEQVRQYRRLLKLDLKQGVKVAKRLQREANIQAKRNQLGG